MSSTLDYGGPDRSGIIFRPTNVTYSPGTQIDVGDLVVSNSNWAFGGVVSASTTTIGAGGNTFVNNTISELIVERKLPDFMRRDPFVTTSLTNLEIVESLLECFTFYEVCKDGADIHVSFKSRFFKRRFVHTFQKGAIWSKHKVKRLAAHKIYFNFLERIRETHNIGNLDEILLEVAPLKLLYYKQLKLQTRSNGGGPKDRSENSRRSIRDHKRDQHSRRK